MAYTRNRLRNSDDLRCYNSYFDPLKVCAQEVMDAKRIYAVTHFNRRFTTNQLHRQEPEPVYIHN